MVKNRIVFSKARTEWPAGFSGCFHERSRRTSIRMFDLPLGTYESWRTKTVYYSTKNNGVTGGYYTCASVFLKTKHSASFVLYLSNKELRSAENNKLKVNCLVLQAECLFRLHDEKALKTSVMLT